jgi:hypothetical protein
MGDSMADSDKQSLGGKARARVLTPNRRKEIAKQAADARWAHPGINLDTVPAAICGGPDKPLRIGDVEIPCYVLDGGKRVIHQRGMVSALGMSRGGSSRGGGDRLAYFVAQKALSPFVSNDLLDVTAKPLLFKTPRGALAYGYEATVLAEICEAILRARQSDALSKQQVHIAENAEMLIRAFARVGIISLVDEATGYQAIRARDELQKILAAYISPELLPYTSRFPQNFYEELHRIRGWKYAPGSNKRNHYIGKLTNELIYKQLPDGVLRTLREKNPILPEKKRRKSLHYKYLTEDVGDPHLKKQIDAVTTLLTVSENWDEFAKLFSRKFKPRDDLFSLPPPEEEAVILTTD